MDERPKESQKKGLSTLTFPSPPHRKAHSYSNVKSTTSGSSTHKRHNNPVRNHSLDEAHVFAHRSGHKKNAYSDSNINATGDGGFSGPSGANGSTVAVDGGGGQEGGDLGAFDDGLLLPNQPLPEFVGNGGGVGVFKVPNRAAVPPSWPPCLEIRPHPLRETQAGKYIRAIASTETQLWAGQESGVRVWNYSDAYEPGIGMGTGKKARRGDEDAAPFYESSNTSPTICMMVDQGCKLIWTGHKDGRIRSWKMEQQFTDGTPFKEGFSWQAHRGPVLSMAISFYGDVWSGSENGGIRVWPWESLEKSLALSPEERHMAALLVERSVVDLRAQVTVNGVCSISSSDVRFLLSDNVRAKVWAAGSLSFSLWNARTKELLKVFNIDGQLENRVDMPSSHDQAVEDEMNVKFVSKTKKDKSQGFLQRSRNAILGAADAVRRAAKGAGAFVEDTKKTEAIVLAPDGIIWTGCSNGLLIHWDGNGNRLHDFTHHPCAVHSFGTHGSRIWVGYASGRIQILDLEGNVINGWGAHNEPVIKLVIGNGYVFSLATHGGIRGWNISSPAPIDNILRTELSERKEMYTKRENVKILIGTWNVGQGRASHGALMSWLGSAVSDVDIVVVGLQEVEMGAGFLAMSAAKETVGLEGSSLGQWWQDHIGKAVDEGSVFERVGSRQLAALLIAIWVRKDVRPHAGDLDVGAVACGLGRAIGNKGGVGLRLRVYDRTICFVNCHLAAHLEAVARRNADFDHIYRTMTFSRSSNLFSTSSAMAIYVIIQTSRGSNCETKIDHKGIPIIVETSVVLLYLQQISRGVDIIAPTYFWLPYSFGLTWIFSIPAGASSPNQMLRGTTAVPVNSEEGRPDLAEADMICFSGDFNYRLFGITYDEARDLVSQRSFDWLREKDQLRAEMKAGKVFQGMREAIIRFPPTYKFEKGKPGLGGYDSGEKKRIPAWCDRILYRDTRAGPTKEISLDCPVIASILQYEACMDVVESDHKPVRCKLNVDIAHVDRSIRRQEFGKILKSNDAIRSSLEALRFVPETTVSTSRIMLQNQDTFNLRITNRSAEEMVFFQIFCEGQCTIKEDEPTPEYKPRGSLGFPRWVEVTPAAGMLRPDQILDISVHHEESQKLEELVESVPQSWWSEDMRDKEFILLVVVRGSCSTEVKTHRVQVRHSFSGNPIRDNHQTSNNSRRYETSLHHRSSGTR